MSTSSSSDSSEKSRRSSGSSGSSGSGAGVAVVSAAEGYPDVPEKGCHIVLPPDNEGAYVLQAGTALDGDHLVAAGGRVQEDVMEGTVAL